MTGYFNEKTLREVQNLLYRENQTRPLEGQCNQEQKEKAKAEPRTPEEKKADQTRAQANTGKDSVPASTRGEAAKKAAETRAKCPGKKPGAGAQNGPR